MKAKEIIGIIVIEIIVIVLLINYFYLCDVNNLEREPIKETIIIKEPCFNEDTANQEGYILFEGVIRREELEEKIKEIENEKS